MKKILLIATGGTIASRPTDGRLSPQISSEELIGFVPEIRGMCDVDTAEPFRRDSTNMAYREWFEIARLIEREYPRYDGFVVTHGTDTMAYCSAALSYFVQDNDRPIVVTGSQKSIYLRDTDARANLYGAFSFACDDGAHGTHVVFDGSVILGTRASKTRTKSYNAFSSMNYPDVARVADGKVVYFIRPETHGDVRFCGAIDPSVAVIKLIPGMSPDIIDYLSGKCRAVIIESFGVGGIPYYDSDDFEGAIRKLRAGGTEVIMTTQVPQEGSDMGLYRVGEISERLGLIEARDMTLEAIAAKTVWALAVRDGRSFRELFLTPVGADILF